MLRQALIVGSLGLLLLLPGSTAAEEEGGDVLGKVRALLAEGNHGKAIALLEDALAETPDDPAMLLELGRAHRARADEALRGSSPVFGRLALADAKATIEKAIAARPDWADAHRELGATAVLGAEWDVAIGAYRRASELEPDDGDTWYQLGYSLAYPRRFHEAIDAFQAAEKLLGPQPRILLNLGISYAGIPVPEKAEATLIRLLEGELAAGRIGSWHTSRGVLWLWRVHAGDRQYDRLETVFADLAERHPDFSSAHWYLGYARFSAGKPAEAVEPFRQVVRLTPKFVAGWQMLARAQAIAGRFDEAEEAWAGYRESGAPQQEALRLLLEIADAMGAAEKRGAAVELLTRSEEAFPDDPELVERKGDMLFREGRFQDAHRELARAAELNPFSDAPAIKAQKAVTAWMRAGGAPAGLRPEPDDAEPGEGGTLYDFEERRVFARLNGCSGGVDEGEIRVERTGEAGSIANLTLTIIPTLDTRPYDSIRFRVRGLAGRTLLVMAKDAWDEFGPSWTRLWFREPILLSGKPQIVTLPLDGFTTPGQRKMPLERSRLRALVFELGVPRSEEDRPASLVWLDDIALVGEGGDRVLADFEEAEDGTLFLSGGPGGSAFARTLFDEEQVRAFVPDPNTHVSPTIFRDAFDPGLVHGGKTAFRLTLTRAAEAFGELTLAPARAERAADATALVFWAKGVEGGERVSLLLRDALDEALGAPGTSAPRMELGGTLAPGRIVLTPEWKRYRIPRSAFPDVDLGQLRSVRFLFGAAEGNAAGASLLIDDIGWE